MKDRYINSQLTNLKEEKKKIEKSKDIAVTTAGLATVAFGICTIGGLFAFPGFALSALVGHAEPELDIEKVRFMCRCWLGTNFYLQTQEWQYKDTERTIVIEKLLTGSNGHIPNDYKLHFINGELAFIYCSVDREGSNKRNIYDANWKPLNFFWVEGCKDVSNLRGEEITPPESLPKMIEIGKNIAEMFDYVRVDFYDIEGKLYFGEVTFHHGSGHDVFTPVEYDEYFGKQLILHKR